MIAVPDRLAGLLRRMNEHHLDLLLVTDPVNVRYLLGRQDIRGGGCLVGRNLLLTSFDFSATFAERPILAIDQVRPVDTASLAHLVHALQGNIGYDDSHLTYRVFKELDALVQAPNRLIAASSLMMSLREQKDATELHTIRRAAGIVDAALEQLSTEVWIGKTEHAVAARADELVMRLGAEGSSFPTAVIAGATSALPHARPSNTREIAADQPVLLDVGCVVDGYCSDCTRMFFTGRPTSRFCEAYELVLAAQEEGLAAISAGARCSDVDQVARKVIDDAGFGAVFGHGLGHGVGLDIHETPRLSRTSTHILQEGNVVTVEPGIYLEGEFGIRIEDLVAVTASGYKNLTAFPKRAPTRVS